MKRVNLARNIKLVGVKNFKKGRKMVDYYLVTGNGDRLYAFSRAYTKSSYDLCKSGIVVTDLLSKRTRNVAVMNLINYLRFMMPCLCEEYELQMAG